MLPPVNIVNIEQPSLEKSANELSIKKPEENIKKETSSLSNEPITLMHKESFGPMTFETPKEVQIVVTKPEETNEQPLDNKSITEQDVTKTPKFEIKESSAPLISTNDSLVFKLNKHELLEKIISLN